MIYLIIIVISLLVLAFLFRVVFKPKPQTAMDGIYFSTQGQSNERIKALGMLNPSEDASHILDSAKLDIPTPELEDNLKEYKANPEREWIIELLLENGGSFKVKDLLQLFDYDWRKDFDSTIYGFSPVDNSWTYALAGGVPPEFSRIQISINLRKAYGEGEGGYDPAKLTRYTAELENRIKKYPAQLSYKELEPVDDAILKAKELVQLFQTFNRDVIIVLQSERPFNGLQAWDALQSVGLAWGDGDLFHWNNHGSDYGNDQHFTVWTTTEPGYFFSEAVKAGDMNPADLVFGFSIPRSADPINVFEAMLQAAIYCQHRLGGYLLSHNGQAFDAGNERKELAAIVSGMQLKGIVPGSTKALRAW